MTSTVPRKSQPLHNFSSLSCPKWNSHPRHHRSSTTVPRSSSPHQSSPLCDSPQRQSPSKHLLPSLRGDPTTETLFLPSQPRQSPKLREYCDCSESPPPSGYSPLLSGSSNDEAAQPLRQSPILGSVAFESDSSLVDKKSMIDYRRQSRNSVPRSGKDDVSSPNRGVTPEKLENQTNRPVSGNREGKKERMSSRVRIRLPPKEKKDTGRKAQEDQKVDNSEVEEDGKQIGALVDEEQVAKTWNFRPRKQRKQLVFDHYGRVFKDPGSSVQAKGVHPTQVNLADMSEAKKKDKKRVFTVSLSKEEIEADIIALIGSIPPKRPKKRSRTAQKGLDHLFPGAWLEPITVKSYKVSENPGKD